MVNLWFQSLVSNMDYEKLASRMREANFEQDVIETFKKERIDTEVFLQMTKQDFVELGICTVGDRRRLLMLKEVRLTSCSYYNSSYADLAIKCNVIFLPFVETSRPWSRELCEQSGPRHCTHS